MVPGFWLLLPVTLLIAVPHFGPWLPQTNQEIDASAVPTPVPGSWWLYLAVFGCVFVTGRFLVVQEAVGVVEFGRTLGVTWLYPRPVGLDGTPLGWSGALARALILWWAGFMGWVGLLDPMWWPGDDRRQCLPDKVAGSVVISDLGELVSRRTSRSGRRLGWARVDTSSETEMFDRYR
jgi:hypothetical protein